jgi:4-alpha-glucanotransferase
VRIIGDLPIFVAHDSADVWSNRELFKLNGDGQPTAVAGVPPDYFSETGQLWGNPLYDWERLRATEFKWWIDRVRWSLELFDLVRIDHFRGFVACWEIPAGDQTAQNGRWIETPGRELFSALKKTLGDLPIIAENLGVITPEVENLREEFGFHGMRVLQFAFGGDATNDHLPHNHTRDSVVYTGTHDNDTTLGWFANLGDDERAYALHYLDAEGDEINWDMIRAAVASVGNLAIIPMQDVLGLGNEARMNLPASETGNWNWRMKPNTVSSETAVRLRELTKLYGRIK